jgi:uncharacterized protein (TIGR00252 family)
MTSTTETGRLAETATAHLLERAGHTILDRNWRNRWCELDLVTRRNGTIHIIEVRYRARPFWGAGLESITADKAARLQRAALAWSQSHGYAGARQIDIASVSGDLAAPQIELVENALAF